MDASITIRYLYGIASIIAPGESMLPTDHEGALELSERQRSVLSLLAGGLTSVEVSHRLATPVDEVRADVRDIITALGARSKLEAVVIALRRGLIHLPNEDRADRPVLRA